MTASVLGTLTREECEACLGHGSVGRVAFTAAGQVHIIPVNYAVDGVTVVFRTSPDTVLSDASLAQVAFEVDSIEQRLRGGWSVVVHGTARELNGRTDPRSQHLRDLLVDCWAPEGRDRWFEIVPDAITGRWLGPAEPDFAARVT